jgi:hypothetical protein
MDKPDITGLFLEDAIKKCKDIGYKIDILFTRPTKAFTEGRPRAVRFSRVSRNRGVLTVVLEVKGRGGGQSGI